MPARLKSIINHPIPFFLNLAPLLFFVAVNATNHLAIKTISGEDMIVALSDRATIKEIKERILERTGIPIYRQRISIGGEIFTNNQLLSTLPATYSNRYDLTNPDTPVYLLLEGQYNQSIKTSEALRKKATLCKRMVQWKRYKKNLTYSLLFVGLLLVAGGGWFAYGKKGHKKAT